MKTIARIAVCTATLACLSFTAAAEGPIRLGDDVQPLAQTIHLELDPRQSDYRGSVRIELDIRTETDRFRLHSAGHELQRVTLSGSRGEIESHYETEGDDILAVTTPASLTPGSYTLEIDFAATFGTSVAGLYKVESADDSYAFTVFQPADARKAFPCWDEPIFKIPFQLTVTIPAELTAISNTPEESVRLDGDHKTVVFAQTPRLPSYGVAISVGPFETVRIDGLRVPGRIVTARGQSHLAAVAAAATQPIFDRLEGYFERPYPYRKLDLIAVPDFPSGALENPAAIVFSEDMLLLDADAASTARRAMQAEIIAHEIAHMWFGNLVTLSWWDDIWLNESFATWIGKKAASQAFPELGLDVIGLRHTRRALELDARDAAIAIRREVDDPKEAFTVGGTLTYNKGAAVLEMFEQWIGEETFQRGVNKYLENHAWGNSTGTDFWHAIDAAAEREVSTAIATFLDQPGFPLIEAELVDGGIELRQRPFSDRGRPQTWQVPVTLKLPTPHGDRTETVMLESASQRLALNQDDGESWSPEWFVLNADASGYYRWSLPTEQLLTLAADASTVLTSRERLDLLSNAGALLTTGALTGDIYLDLAGRFANDTDPAVIGALASALAGIEDTYITSDLEESFAAYVRRTLGPALERFGMEPSPGEAEAVALARDDLYLLLGRDGGVPTIRQHAATAIRDFLAGGELAPELVRPALRVAAADGDAELFDAYLEHFNAASSPAHRAHLAFAMGSFGHPDIRDRALDQILGSTLQVNEIIGLAMAMLEDDAAADQLYRWLKTNYGALAARMPPMFVPFMPRFVGGCSADRLNDAEIFFAQPEHQAPGTENQLAQVGEEVRECVRLRTREAEAVGRYLRQTAQTSMAQASIAETATAQVSTATP